MSVWGRARVLVVGQDAELETDWGNACHLYSGDGIGYRMLTPELYVCLIG